MFVLQWHIPWRMNSGLGRASVAADGQRMKNWLRLSELHAASVYPDRTVGCSDPNRSFWGQVADDPAWHSWQMGAKWIPEIWVELCWWSTNTNRPNIHRCSSGSLFSHRIVFSNWPSNSARCTRIPLQILPPSWWTLHAQKGIQVVRSIVPNVDQYN